MSWDVDKLKFLVTSKVSKEANEKIIDSINSIQNRMHYSRYHFWEYKTIIDNLDNFSKRMSLIFKTKDEYDFDTAIKIEANIIGCLQNMHAIYDILAYVINYSLNLGIKEDKITIYSVKKELNSKSECIDLMNLMEELMEHDNFKYLNANVNHSKHRSLISLCYSISFIDDWHGHKFISFNYKGGEYTERNIYDFIIEEYNRESQLVIRIGNELNTILESSL
ncbi:MAG: hypothetical protein AB7E37_08485 [Candidatus Altimarinota bacterium]